MYLEISNKGVIDPLAFVLMGASTKNGNDGKIGMFGSGNKYAIACLMRYGIKFKVFKGKAEVRFETRPVKMRNQVYNKIMINGSNTSLTTSMGKDWKVWQAIRELYANALDEGLLKFDYADDINPEANTTKIYLELTDDVEEVIQNKHKYFSEGRTVIAENKIGKIYRNEGTPMRIYRKGIRCYEGKERSMFDYDFNEIEITESRIVKYSWQLHSEVWKCLFATENQTVIRKLVTELNGDENYFETSSINSSWVDANDANILSEGWKKLLQEKYLISPSMYKFAEPDERKKSIVIPYNLHHILDVKLTNTPIEVSPPSFKKTTGDRYKPLKEYNQLQNDILKKAQNFFEEAGFEIPYKIQIVTFLKPNTLGSIDGETILLGVKSVDMGVHDTINTILEEYIHIKYGVKDETREFQTAAIDELVNYMKIKTGITV